LQISTKAQVEWGYRNEENAWVAVDKSVLDSVQEAGIEKSMGFEGTPDPTTGFYCVRS
jgi:formylmethanofuran:tetrahydromethanopterin formyltransferase